ncbi:hypothetical protein PV325_004873 [Microctonus aethiopoides]|nr:hypothetical protein PV325_004873 [Microctonus aethiopoides]KAK0095453.1 hypothetical protein PV326_008309 [Microctonus aethiopoides]KAK0165149.1 hypothetical protein PV328_003696 [Microctonus aethiopoides]
MTTVKGPEGIDIKRFPKFKEGFEAKPWKIQATRSHILHSKCSQNEETCALNPCNFCVYNRELELKHLPDMVFPNNILSLEHETGAKIEFNALDALKRVSNGKINIRLPIANEWRESRADCKEFLEEKVKPFDWTFTTDYMGTISGFHVEETEDRINFDLLTRRGGISFYQDLTLYEDEVHDRGVASLSVKIRVMTDGLFILLRYFLRIDGSMIRINDTRIYHHFQTPYILREYTSRESKIKDLDVPPGLLIEPSLIASRVPLKHSVYHKLSIEPKPGEDTTQLLDNQSTNDAAQVEAMHEDEASNSNT